MVKRQPEPGLAAAQQQLVESVRRMIALSVLYNDQVSAKVGISASESQSMHLLQLNGPMTPGRLSEVTGLTSGTITGVVDRLEALGLVHRERSTEDRRKVLVILDEGALFARMAPYYAEHGRHLDEVVAGLTADEIITITGFLHALAPPDGAPAAVPEPVLPAIPATIDDASPPAARRTRRARSAG